MTTVESLLSWESSKLESISKESGDVAKLVNAFKDFLSTVAEERQRFSEERSVLAQQIKVFLYIIMLCWFFGFVVIHVIFVAN